MYRHNVRSYASVVVAVVLAASTLLAVAAVRSDGVPPGDAPVTGTLNPVPAIYAADDTIELQANFDVDTASQDVSFYERKSGEDWEYLAADVTNANGNAYIDHEVDDEAVEVYARTDGGDRTDVTTLDPGQFGPNGEVTGTLTPQPAEFFEGDRIQLWANFDVSAEGQEVTLFEETDTDVWETVGSDVANVNGNGYPQFDVPADSVRVFAQLPNGDRTPVITLTPAEPKEIVPGDGAETGALNPIPTSFFEGDLIRLRANFPAGASGQQATLYAESDAGVWEEAGSSTANINGNAYFDDFEVPADPVRMFAELPNGDETDVITLTPEETPEPGPNGEVTGALTPQPASFSEGDRIQLWANFAASAEGQDVALFEETGSDEWTKVSSDVANANGNAYPGYEIPADPVRVYAQLPNGDRTEIITLTPVPDVTLDIQRDCTDNSCGDTATAVGTVTPVDEGREFTLERRPKVGDPYAPIAEPVSPNASGRFEVQFSLDDLDQWESLKYRFVSDGVDGNDARVVSNYSYFMPGPTQHAKNILRVDVDDEVFPKSKGPEYSGTATLSVDSATELDEIEVDEFGVRGSSSAGYAKKPFKLKFEDSTQPFGMAGDKSWTLLASWIDQSFVRDKVALGLGRDLSGIHWTPDSRMVELFLNDEYRGAYIMTESVKIDGDRVDVDKETGMIMETDGSSVTDSARGFESDGGYVFQFKDPDDPKTLDNGQPDPESITSQKRNAVRNRVNAFEDVLYSNPTMGQINDFIDVDSAVDYYLVKEFAKDQDAYFYRSDYFAWDMDDNGNDALSDGLFHWGPAWDFDRSAGNVSDGGAKFNYTQSPVGNYMAGGGDGYGRKDYNSHWFVQLMNISTFRDTVEARWNVVKGQFADADQDARAAAAELGPGGQNDRKRWENSEGGAKRYREFTNYQSEIDYVADWYQDRYDWMDGYLS